MKIRQVRRINTGEEPQKTTRKVGKLPLRKVLNECPFRYICQCSLIEGKWKLPGLLPGLQKALED